MRRLGLDESSIMDMISSQIIEHSIPRSDSGDEDSDVDEEDEDEDEGKILAIEPLGIFRSSTGHS